MLHRHSSVVPKQIPSNTLTFSSWLAVILSTQREKRLEKPMDVSSASSTQNIAVMAKTREATEGPGPDRDGDSDDKSAAVKSAVAPGVGGVVDKAA